MNNFYPESESMFFIEDKSPQKNGVILARDEDGSVWTNVPWTVIHHSPSGFSWGYAGSGPADLALNICEMILSHEGFEGERTNDLHKGDCFLAAWLMHQAFKNKHVVGIPQEGGILPYEWIRKWVLIRVDMWNPPSKEE